MAGTATSFMKPMELSGYIMQRPGPSGNQVLLRKAWRGPVHFRGHTDTPGFDDVTASSDPSLG